MSSEHRTTQRQRHSETATINGATDSGGRYGDLNQDRYLVHTITNTDESHPQKMARIAGVFDGHSMLGELAAQTASDAFRNFFEKAIRAEWSNGNSFVPTESIINEAFDYAHSKIVARYEDLPKDYKYPIHGKMTSFHLKDGTQTYVSSSNDERPIDFGTTAVVALIIDDTLVVANSGDSQCIVGTKDEKTVYLSTAHSCKNRDEVRRIRTEFPESKFTSGGNYLRASEDGANEVFINMTRALGHKSLSKFGVIHNPSISFKTLTEDDAFIILASDGVWDNLTGHEAVMFVTDSIDDGEDLAEIPKNLIDKSFEDVDSISHRDNATAVVITLP